MSITGIFSCFPSLRGPQCGAGKRVGLEFRESWGRQMLGHGANRNIVCSPAVDPGNRFPSPPQSLVAVELISCCFLFILWFIFQKRLMFLFIETTTTTWWGLVPCTTSPRDPKDLNCPFTAELACTRGAGDLSVENSADGTVGARFGTETLHYSTPNRRTRVGVYLLSAGTSAAV